MALNKIIKYDIKRKYYRVLQISFILSLSLLILAFRFFPDVATRKSNSEAPPELVNVIECSFPVYPAPPPPPKPPIPIEAPTDEVLEDFLIEPNDLIIDAEVPPPPPPPKVEEEEPIPIFVPFAEIMPKPIGGISAIQKRIAYPEFEKRAGIQGRVFVKAYIDEKGNVSKVELVKGISSGCDEVAMSAVENSLFSPGKQRGKPVKVQVTIPILFKLR